MSTYVYWNDTRQKEYESDQRTREKNAEDVKQKAGEAAFALAVGNNHASEITALTNKIMEIDIELAKLRNQQRDLESTKHFLEMLAAQLTKCNMLNIAQKEEEQQQKKRKQLDNNTK